MNTVDLAIVGGGINGVGIAALAASLGLSVCLFEQDELASHTSSKSSKLIHGGLRYLEQYKFALVRESLTEREILWQMAPQIIHPLTFILPHALHLRPYWMIRTGLWIYDHLGKKTRLPSSQAIQFDTQTSKDILKPEFTRGFTYSDCWVDDAQLVKANALYAQKKSAKIYIHTPVLKVEAKNACWTIHTPQQQFTARVLINATGPWVSDFLQQQNLPTDQKIRLVQGSHIIMPKLYEGEHAYTLQNPDGRIVFVLPYKNNYSVIGTTDTPYQGNPAQAKITAEEINYLCSTVNRYFKTPITPSQIYDAFSGVRPLLDDGADNSSKVTREYLLELKQVQQAPLLSIFGGKITTYRRLALAALEKLHPYFATQFPLSALKDWRVNLID